MSPSDQRPNQARVLLVIGHGRRTGLCRHLLEIARETLQDLGTTLRVHDPMADGFDPVLRLEPDQPYSYPVREQDDPLAFRYQQDVLWANTYIIIHPVWWFAPPAILKGWIERVLVDGVAMKHAPGERPRPLLSGRRALLVQTFGTRRMIDRLVCRNVAWNFWRKAVFLPVGIRKSSRLAIYSAKNLDPERMSSLRRRLRSGIASLVTRP